MPAGHVRDFDELLRRLTREEATRLPEPELRIKAAAIQKFGMRPFFDNLAIFHHNETVHRRDRRQPMRNRDHSLAAHEPFETRLNGRFNFGIERTGRFVEHKDRCILQEHARDGDTLPLAAGQLHAALTDVRVLPLAALHILKVQDEVVRFSLLRRRDDLRLRGIEAAVEDVVTD